MPDEDQGYFITIIQAPEGVSLQYTSKVIDQVEKEILKLPEVVGTFSWEVLVLVGIVRIRGLFLPPLNPGKNEKPKGNPFKRSLVNYLENLR